MAQVSAGEPTSKYRDSDVTSAQATQIRLLRGDDCWWAIGRKTYARIPVHGVVERQHRRTLTSAAYRHLAERQFFAEPRNSVYSVTVLTATSCNLGCAYCFQNTALSKDGSFAPPRIPTARLNSDLVGQAATFIGRQMTRLGLADCSLLLFGGEPLLNPLAAISMLQAMQPLGLTYAEVITNGVLLTRRLAEKLVDAGLRRAQITFDGARDTHDRIRVTRSGRGTYDRILRNVEVVAGSIDISWHFRINVSHRNFDGLEELINDLSAVVPSGKASLHLALIDDIGLGYDNAVGYTPECAERFMALNDRAIRNGMTIPVSKPVSACPYCSVFGGDRGAVINADGKLYSSWETAGRDEWIVGDIHNGYLPEEMIRPRWVACDYDIKSHGTDEQTRHFFDRIDAAALDSMHPRKEEPATK